MGRGRGPILSATPSGPQVAMHIDPAIRNDEVLFARLRLMLAALCKTSDLSLPQRTPPDLIAYSSRDTQGRKHNLAHCSADWLNEELAKLREDPVLVVRRSRTDMVVYVVAQDGVHMQDLHAWHLRKLPGVRLSRLAADGIYEGIVIELLVPELDMGVEFDTLTSAIRAALRFSLVS